MYFSQDDQEDKKKMMPVKFLNIVNTQQMVIGIIMPCCLGAFTPHFVLI